MAQIHELNTFAGTLGAGAYLAIDDGTDTGKISSQSLLAATEARIDNIIAGPAPSAEEIVDARLGADGVTYSSLGDAIRDQFTDVKSALNKILNKTDYSYSAGYINNSVSPVNINSVTVAGAWTHAVAPCEGGDVFTLTATGGGTPRSWCFIKADGTIISNSGSYASATDEVIVAPKDSAYLVSNDNGGTGYLYKGGYQIDDLVSLVEKTKTYSFVNNGYVDTTDGVYHDYGGGTYKATNLIPVAEGNIISIVGTGFSEQYAWYDKARTFISGVSNPNNVHTEPLSVPSNAKYFRMSLVLSSYDVSELSVNVLPINKAISLLLGTRNTVEEAQAYPFNNNGYVEPTDGVYHAYGDGAYKATDLIPVAEGNGIVVKGSGFGEQYAWYDKTKAYISGISNLNDVHTQPLAVPPNARYFRMSLMPSGIDLSNLSVSVLPLSSVAEQLYSRITRSDIVINCVGDSVTEGMGVDGDYTSDYGKDPYPAKLYTLLVDNGYDCIVNNYGHGGERIPDMATRIGAYPCIFTEDVTIPADNSPASLGVMTSVDGRVTGTKIAVPYADSLGNDYCVFFTQTNHDTNPLYIDGVEYILSIGTNENFIKKRINDSTQTVIKKDMFLFTRDNKNPTVNIVMGGINDGRSMTLERYINMMKACVDATGKAIIIGSTHLLCSAWSDVTGSSAAEKWQKYHRACVEAFGNKFLDLYFEFPLHAVEYALASGYWSTKTAEELEAIQDKLDAHIIPSELTVDGVENNVHLNEVGYQVIGMLVFERLKRLNYISKQQ